MWGGVWGGCGVSICRVEDDDATSEWIQIISGWPQGSVLGPLLFILYTSEMFDLAENRILATADDSTPLAVVCKAADRSAVAASLKKDLIGFMSGTITGT